MNEAREIANVCVYCGSSPGHDPAFQQAAERFGRILAENGVGLVYGGGNLGLMGAVARSAIEAGGRVVGIIPGFLAKREHMLEAVQELLVVDDMHTRKRLMFEKADAFVAFPGGIGTLEELVEQLTWAQLGRHDKPVLIADLAGFWAPLLGLLDHMRETGFIRREYEARYLVRDRVEDILPALRAAYAATARPRRALPQEF
ncbi:uncharacterized protein (TIGR00730 family) [Rhodoblastus acidophilus]|uniref:LOG family protein n=1 Tax=Rhodoblastus acidophilus TaxID=1074 RepID=UPI00222599D1|nr:TIGR00730 family Rossman fold protein [Rhodoblastus acidophilus]MCW2315154.1 uncharacterized protein (TIGR00730 family) [Rhodoblastus acidophilus]